MDPSAHRFRFSRVGGFDQVLLERGEDLLALDQLDQKLWGALSCPVRGLEFDEVTLALIDANGDGRIRVPEILAATRWAGMVLRDPDDLVKGADSLLLSAVAEEHPDAKAILTSARQIASDLGKGEAEPITLDEVVKIARSFSKTRFNGDGIVPPKMAEDEALEALMSEIVASVGGEEDRGGEVGVSKAKVQAFFEALAAFDGWWTRAEADAETVLPLGKETPAAFALITELRAKVEDWFARSRLAAFDPRALAPLNRDEAEYVTVATMVLSRHGEEVAALPLAKVIADGALPLEKGINPAWVERIQTLRRQVVEPLIGPRDSLTAEDWAAVVGRFEIYEGWSKAKAGVEVEALGIQRIRELLRGDARAKIEALIARDEALAPVASGIALVEKLLRYQRDLHRLLCNFVSFTDFYSKRKAIFQAGTLYLDQRSCDLCVQVVDPDAHAAIAKESSTFLVYCACRRKSDGKTMTIAAAFTDGDSEHLAIGRNGIFYDRKGDDWDATVIKLVEHPISVRQAFWLPYRRIGKLVGAQIERLASARDKDLQEKAAARLEGAADVEPVEAGASAKAQAFDVAKFAGIFAAIGLAIGAIGSALAAVGAGLLSLAWWQLPLVLLGLVLLVSGPSMIIAWLKLRQRSLGPILDANGWAVNTRARINIPFGASLTSVAALPSNAVRLLHDPFAAKRNPWTAWAVVAIVAALAFAAWYGDFPRPWFRSQEMAKEAQVDAPADARAPAPPADGAPAK